jgi:capsule biosynthesis phosphatase
MNIIIPLGGIGERFVKENYTEPKPLIKIFGKSMIFHVIDNLKLYPNDNLIIIYNKELNKFNFNKILKTKYPNILLIELNKQTEGAAETVLIGLNSIDNKMLNNKNILLDCDTFYKTDILSVYRNQKHNAVFCFKDAQAKPIYSYIKFDSNNIINEIKEKVKISNYANTGCYCFEDGHVLKKYCELILSDNIRQNNEFYTSGVIDAMINDNHIFEANIIKYEDVVCVGTPFQLKIYCSDITNNLEKKRFCFDLDNTLVTSPEILNDYSTVKPITKNIEMLKFLKLLGHTIIIYTARRMRTHNGNIGLITKDIAEITINTLKKFDVPYDELYFGKPYADFYIDDLAVNCHYDLEKELGFYKTHINERDFNEISSDKMDIIIKKSINNKIEGEIYYYQNIPKELNQYFPLFIKYGYNWYSMEKIKGITISYMFVNESVTEELFQRIMNIFYEMHNYKKSNVNTELNIYKNYVNKIKERYSNYDYSKFQNSDKIYNYLINYFEDYEKKKLGKANIIHGDPVFSNCILNNDNDIKLIDMRGKIDNTLTIYGDIFYDYAKIYQSLLGYDEILLDKQISNEYKNKLINIFFNYIIKNYGEDYVKIIKNITNSLLFTLIPLHDNNKCIDYYNLINIPEINSSTHKGGAMFFENIFKK